MDELIEAAFRDCSRIPAHLKALIGQHVVIIANWDNPKSNTINIQDFVKDNESFIPVFSNVDDFRDETRGLNVKDRGVSIDADLLGSILNGSELLILNPGSKTPVRFRGKALKEFVDAARLPERRERGL